MGAEYHCYASDITCSYPVSGRFSPRQRFVYQAVLDAQVAVITAMRPGVAWTDMHRLAERTVLRHLVAEGLLVGDVEEMLELRVGAVFIPCGLGHLIGLDTHDVGGYLAGFPERIQQPGLKSLRTARALEEGMCLTVEPGLYFVDCLLDRAMAEGSEMARFFVPEEIAPYRGFGGVRLEDVVVVTADGVVNYTLCPRTVEEVEDVMAGGAWPPAADALPQLQRAWGKLSDDGKGIVDVAL
uniref:Peptidase M24 domain-containing protein n=2 Tax=Phaeomonas parva TaxID=124430 RepID=A0A7S1UG11_9STRA|mmetsp:Transcript_46436/g.145318  ORF Transcript_46436/g.145318 Transcript_46436/m.145318 type:complete len:240 (+) Transcript_46436:377-1096(+)